MKKNILAFLTLFLIPFVSAATKRFDFQKTLNSILTTPVTLLNTGGVELWIFLCVLSFLFIIWFLLFQRIKFIGENRTAALILSLICSFIGVTMSGVSLVFVSLIEFSMVLFVIVAVLFLIAFAWVGYVRGHHKLTSEVAQEHASQSIELMNAKDELRKEKKYYKKENVLYYQEIRDFEEIAKRIKNLPNKNDPNYNSSKDSIKQELNDAMLRVRRTISLDKRKLNLGTKDRREIKMRKVDADILHRVSESKSMLDRGNTHRAKSEVDKIVKLLKGQKKLLANWFKHEKRDYNEEVQEEQEEDYGESSEQGGRQEDLGKKEYVEEEGRKTREELEQLIEKLNRNNIDIQKFVKMYYELLKNFINYLKNQKEIPQKIDERQAKEYWVNYVEQPLRSELGEIARTYQLSSGRGEPLQLTSGSQRADQINDIEGNRKYLNKLQKKIEKINKVYSPDRQKRPEKVFKHIRDDIWKEMKDREFIDLIETLRQKDRFDAYTTQFNQIIDFFEHNKKPYEADERDWASVFKVIESYKNFLLMIRDKL